MTPTPVQILLIDDEESQFVMTQALLGSLENPPMEVDWAATFDDGLARLLEHRHDVCLLDYYLDESTGLDLLRAARSRGVRTPVILLTGKGSREVDLEAMKAGAVDYLDKGETNPEAMERSIRYAVERSRAAEELRRSEERHRGMFDHLPLGLFRVSGEGEYMEANPALIRILDYPDRKILERDYAPNFFVSPRDRDRFFETLTEYGVVLGFESDVRTQSARTIRVRATARVHRGSTGRMEYVEGSVEDITDQAPSREREEMAAAFRALSGISASGIALTDSDGRVRSINPALAKLLGRDASEVEGEPIWDLFHPDDAGEVARELERLSGDAAREAHREVRLLSGSGETFRLRLGAAPVARGRNEPPAGVLVLLETAENRSTG